MWLFVAFLLVPLIEIALFIQIGGWLTLWPTLAIVIATAMIGTWLVRQQGAWALAELRGSLENLRDPMAPLAQGAMILFAGALLLTPGFLTDTVGFLLLVPAVRQALLREAMRRVRLRQAQFHYGTRQDGHGARRADGVIDADFEDIPHPDKPDETGAVRPVQTRPSGWSRH
jgi:UPF0716 protein FxsA